MSSGNTGQSTPPDRTGLHGLRQSSASTSTPTLDLTLRRIVALLLYIEHQKGKDYGAPFEQQLNQIIQEDDKALIASLRETQTNELLFEAEMLFGGDIAHLERNFNEHLLELEERSLKHLLTSYMSELGLAEKAKNKVKSDEIIQKCQEISLKLSELHKKRQHHFKK
jgi:hypothetical protein